MQLNGWLRLWVVLCVLLSLPAGASLFVLWPTSRSVTHTEEFNRELTPEAKSQLAAEGEEGGITVRMPNEHLISLKRGIEPTRKTDAVIEYGTILDTEARKLQFKVIAYAIGAWVGACVVLLTVGYAIAWVAQGFRRGKNAP